jgi:PAS domain S-box-containing protein
MVFTKVTRRNTRRMGIHLAAERLERERLLSLINSMGDGVIALDTTLHVVVYNGAALNILDSNTTLEGKKLRGLVELIDKDKKPVDLAEVVRSTKITTNSRDYTIQYRDGTQANLYLSIAPVHLGYGKAGSEGYVLVLRDITREKSLEDERDEFISVVSHELRTPIAISEGNISNALFVANSTDAAPEISKALQAAYDQILFLADMINDLSMLSRAERGTLNVEVERIDVDELVKDLRQVYQPQADTKGLQFFVHIGKHVNVLYSSKLYVREILQNFITNALKYTESGSVTLKVTASKRGVEFSVADTGIGISKSDQAKVFDKFFRSEAYRTRQTTGTGLGLYVTKKLARLIEADIELESAVGKGTKITICVPSVSQQE